MKSREKSIFQVLQNKHFSRNSRDLCLWSWVKHDYIERLLWPFPKSYIFQSLLGLFQGFLAFSNASWPFPRLFGLFQVQSFLGLFQSLAFSNVSGLFAMPFPKHMCLLPFPRHGKPLGFAFSKATCQSFFQSHSGYNYIRCLFQNPHAFPKACVPFAFSKAWPATWVCFFQSKLLQLGYLIPAKALSKAT